VGDHCTLQMQLSSYHAPPLRKQRMTDAIMCNRWRIDPAV